MAQRTINCDLHLAPDDFIMRDHRVHGVSVLPGAAFLDIVHRIIEAQGFDGSQAANCATSSSPRLWRRTRGPAGTSG